MTFSSVGVPFLFALCILAIDPFKGTRGHLNVVIEQKNFFLEREREKCEGAEFMSLSINNT